jgi:hypothetical protein
MPFCLIACDYAARLDLYSFHVLMLLCHSIVPLLVARVATQRDHLHFLCHLVRFAFIVLHIYNAPGLMAEVICGSRGFERLEEWA